MNLWVVLSVKVTKFLLKNEPPLLKAVQKLDTKTTCIWWDFIAASVVCREMVARGSAMEVNRSGGINSSERRICPAHASWSSSSWTTNSPTVVQQAILPGAAQLTTRLPDLVATVTIWLLWECCHGRDTQVSKFRSGKFDQAGGNFDSQHRRFSAKFHVGPSEPTLVSAFVNQLHVLFSVG